MANPALEHFSACLRETIHWCSSRFSMERLADSLRSSELRPELNIVHDARGIEIVRETVWTVIRRRSESVRDQTDSALPSAALSLAMGRLFALFPQESIFCGLSVYETGGFIDEDEIPPWDSWVYFVDDFLVSWVPANLVSAVECAIACNPEESIKWLRDVDHPFVGILRSEELV